jgi:hypothetical protein
MIIKIFTKRKEVYYHEDDYCQIKILPKYNLDELKTKNRKI